VLKRRFASSVLHSSNVKTQICVTGPQCVNKIFIMNYDQITFNEVSNQLMELEIIASL